MLPQLRAQLDPRSAFLRDLYAARVEPPMALLQLGAFHAGRAPDAVSFRRDFVAAGDQVFPHPRDVPGLLVLLMNRVFDELQTCTSVRDDLHVAALAIYGVLAIHPFENGNGRAAVDLAQYLLMVRWHQQAPPLKVGDDTHRLLGSVFKPLDERCDGRRAEDLFRLREGLAARIARAELELLTRTPAFRVAARWLELALHTPSLIEENRHAV